GICNRCSAQIICYFVECVAKLVRFVAFVCSLSITYAIWVLLRIVTSAVLTRECRFYNPALCPLAASVEELRNARRHRSPAPLFLALSLYFEVQVHRVDGASLRAEKLLRRVRVKRCHLPVFPFD